MGITVDDANIHGHATANGPRDAFGHYHRGDQGISDPSANIGVPGVGDLIRGASSQTAFDTAAAGVYGSWYTSKPTGFKVAHFQWFEELRNNLLTNGI